MGLSKVPICIWCQQQAWAETPPVSFFSKLCTQRPLDIPGPPQLKSPHITTTPQLNPFFPFSHSLKKPKKTQQKKNAHTFPRGIQRFHIKHINPLHLAQYLQSLQPRSLLKVRGYGAGLCAGPIEVVKGFDFCIDTRGKLGELVSVV